MPIAIDYYSPKPLDTMRCWKSSGVDAIARYLTTRQPWDLRSLTSQEVADAHEAGLAVHLVFEMNATYVAYFSLSQGRADAEAAIAHADALGAPHGSVVYFAVDAPPSVIPPEALDPYFNGVEEVCNASGGRITPGMYGFEAHIAYARLNYPNIGKHLWQTYGTPQGPLDCDLWQHEQRDLCGVQVDINDCYVEGWEADMPSETQIREWAKEEARAVLALEYGPALEQELTQRFGANSANDVADAVRATTELIAAKLTEPID